MPKGVLGIKAKGEKMTTENQTEEPSLDKILYGSIIDWLAEIKEKGIFPPIDKIDEFGPDWDYVGTMNQDVKTLWTALEKIRTAGKAVVKKMGTGEDDALLLQQNEMLIERHQIIKALMDNCINAQIAKDLNVTGVDVSRLEIAIADDYRLFVRPKEDEGKCNCPVCQMEKTNMPVITVDMMIASPSELSSVELEMIALSLFGGLRTKKRSGSDHEECDHDLADDPTGQDKEN